MFWILFFFCRTKARTAASIILRGPNDFYCDEMERSVHDALCVVKRVLESKSVVPGGGAVETALSIYLENFATSLVSPIHDCYVLHSNCLKKTGLVVLIVVFFRVLASSSQSQSSPSRCWSSRSSWQ